MSSAINTIMGTAQNFACDAAKSDSKTIKQQGFNVANEAIGAQLAIKSVGEALLNSLPGNEDQNSLRNAITTMDKLIEETDCVLDATESKPTCGQKVMKQLQTFKTGLVVGLLAYTPTRAMIAKTVIVAGQMLSIGCAKYFPTDTSGSEKFPGTFANATGTT